MQRICVHVREGSKVIADVLQPKKEKVHMMYLHGFCSKRVSEKSDALLEDAVARGWGLIRADFRGHGESSGKICEVTMSGLLEDAQMVLQKAEINDGKVVLVGSSIGGLVAARLAAVDKRVKAVLLIAPAAQAISRWRTLSNSAHGGCVLSSSFVGDIHIGACMFEDAERHSWNDEHLAAHLKVPTLVVHGSCDDVVPVASSEAFYKLIAAEHKKWVNIPGEGHRLNEPIKNILAWMHEFMRDSHVFLA